MHLLATPITSGVPFSPNPVDDLQILFQFEFMRNAYIAGTAAAVAAGPTRIANASRTPTIGVTTDAVTARMPRSSNEMMRTRTPRACAMSASSDENSSGRYTAAMAARIAATATTVISTSPKLTATTSPTSTGTAAAALASARNNSPRPNAAVRTTPVTTSRSRSLPPHTAITAAPMLLMSSSPYSGFTDAASAPVAPANPICVSVCAAKLRLRSTTK